MVVKYFTSWLKKNNNRFNHRLKIVERGTSPYMGEYIRLQYHGIIPDIKILVHKKGIDIEVYYYGELFDLLVDLEIEVEKLSPGQFCCRLCREYESEKMKIYSSARELIHEHTYEDLLRWSNEKISILNYLFLVGSDGGSRCASIYTDESFSRMNKKFKTKKDALKNLFNLTLQISSLKDFRCEKF